MPSVILFVKDAPFKMEYQWITHTHLQLCRWAETHGADYELYDVGRYVDSNIQMTYSVTDTPTVRIEDDDKSSGILLESWEAIDQWLWTELAPYEKEES